MHRQQGRGWRHHWATWRRNSGRAQSKARASAAAAVRDGPQLQPLCTPPFLFVLPRRAWLQSARVATWLSDRRAGSGRCTVGRPRRCDAHAPPLLFFPFLFCPNSTAASRPPHRTSPTATPPPPCRSPPPPPPPTRTAFGSTWTRRSSSRVRWRRSTWPICSLIATSTRPRSGQPDGQRGRRSKEQAIGRVEWRALAGVALYMWRMADHVSALTDWLRSPSALYLSAPLPSLSLCLDPALCFPRAAGAPA